MSLKPINSPILYNITNDKNMHSMTTNISNLLLMKDNDIEYLDEILSIMRLICGKILTPVLCTIGFISNIVNIIILTREWMSSSTNVYLTAVSLCDLLYLLFSCLFSLWIYPCTKLFAPFAYSITFIHGTANLFSNTTTWLTVGFTLERYIAISSPILGRRLCTKQRARYVVISICIISFTLTLPDYFKKTVQYMEITNDNKQNLSITSSSSSSFIGQYLVVDTRFNPILTKIGYDYMNQTVFVILPMILLIIFNSLLVRSVMQANHNRKILTKQTSSNNATPIKVSTDSRRIKLLDTNGNSGGIQLNQEATTSHIVPAIMREALQASMRTTVEITSSITQSFRPINNPTGLFPIMNMKRTKLSEQHRITLMLISIVMAFVILQLPSMVPTITINLWNAGIVKPTQYAKKCLLIYANISNVLLIINAAMNFVFYSLFSAKFRQTCCLLLQNITCLKQYYKNKSSNLNSNQQIDKNLNCCRFSKVKRKSKEKDTLTIT
ncbi:unnamed protein product [Heterobilharzia americana]|nr:unnamed protein product [Heterobilharzia americana]